SEASSGCGREALTTVAIGDGGGGDVVWWWALNNRRGSRVSTTGGCLSIAFLPGEVAIVTGACQFVIGFFARARIFSQDAQQVCVVGTARARTQQTVSRITQT